MRHRPPIQRILSCRQKASQLARASRFADPFTISLVSGLVFRSLAFPSWQNPMRRLSQVQ